MIIWSDLKYNRKKFFQECKNIFLEKTYKLRKRFMRRTYSYTARPSLSGKSTNYIRDAYRKEANPMVDKAMARMNRVEY